MISSEDNKLNSAEQKKIYKMRESIVEKEKMFVTSIFSIFLKDLKTPDFFGTSLCCDKALYLYGKQAYFRLDKKTNIG